MKKIILMSIISLLLIFVLIGCQKNILGQATGVTCIDNDKYAGTNVQQSYVKSDASTTNLVGYPRLVLDTCFNSTRVYERVCNGNVGGTFPYDCPLGCLNGACISPPISLCSDTDATAQYPNGRNYYLKGKTTGLENGQIITSLDNCRYDNINLIEVYCSGDNLLVESYTCPNGCVNGACN